MAVDKALAQSLRQQGYTYPQIAAKLQCSLSWCKANLAQIKKPKDSDTLLIETIRLLGKSKDGITTGQIKTLTQQEYPSLTETEIAAKVERLKINARRNNKDVVIRPYWLQPQDAQNSINLIMDMSQQVYELKERLAEDFRKEYDLDISYQKSIVYALSSLSTGLKSKLLPQGIIDYGDALESVVFYLEPRNL